MEPKKHGCHYFCKNGKCSFTDAECEGRHDGYPHFPHLCKICKAENQADTSQQIPLLQVVQKSPQPEENKNDTDGEEFFFNKKNQTQKNATAANILNPKVQSSQERDSRQNPLIVQQKQTEYNHSISKPLQHQPQTNLNNNSINYLYSLPQGVRNYPNQEIGSNTSNNNNNNLDFERFRRQFEINNLSQKKEENKFDRINFSSQNLQNNDLMAQNQSSDNWRKKCSEKEKNKNLNNDEKNMKKSENKKRDKNNKNNKNNKKTEKTFELKKATCHDYHVKKDCKNSNCKYGHEGYIHDSNICKVCLKQIEAEDNKIKLQKELNLTLKTNVNSLKNKYYLDLSGFQKIIAEDSVDILFIVDITGSMDPWIKAVAQGIFIVFIFIYLLSSIGIHNLTIGIQLKFPKIKIRFGFIGYRDYKVTKSPSGSLNIVDYDIEGIPFTIDSKNFSQAVLNRKADGGDDKPEDAARALAAGLSSKYFDWKSKTRYCILITDAPPHGKDYHDLKFDNFPNGVPENKKIEDLFAEYAKKEINFFCVSIDPENSTDKFFKIAHNSYAKAKTNKTQALLIIDLVKDLENNVGSLLEYIMILSVQASISRTKLLNNLPPLQAGAGISNFYYPTIVNQNSSEVYSVRFEKNFPDWTKVKIEKAVCKTCYLKKEKSGKIINWLKPGFKFNKIPVKIQVSENPFTMGSMRYCYYMKDLEFPNKIFICKKTFDIQNHLTKEEDMKRELYSTVVANYIAEEFNDRVQQFRPYKNEIVSFVPAYIYGVEVGKDQTCYYQVEEYIENLHTSFTKYNDNDGGVFNENKAGFERAQAFSHFTWQFSLGHLMITDIQGNEQLWTDPKIHTLDGNKEYELGNFGEKGIIKFFITHQCNGYCKELKLFNPLEEDALNLKLEFDFKKENYQNGVDHFQMCNLCCKIFQIEKNNLSKYSKLREICKDCKQNGEKNEQIATCFKCRKEARVNLYWLKLKRIDPLEFHAKCKDCSKKKRKGKESKIQQNDGKKNISHQNKFYIQFKIHLKQIFFCLKVQ